MTFEQIRDLLIDRLVNGVFPVGSKLPPARELADQTGAHRNTVAKAYSALAEMGMVSMRPGRGTYVTSLNHPLAHASLSDRLYEDFDKLIAHAKRIGIHKQDLGQTIAGRIESIYTPGSHAAMVECNWEDIQSYIAEIQASTGVKLNPLLLNDLRATPALAQRSGLVVTTLFHLKEVNAIVNAASLPVEVVGLYTQPDENALRRVAEIGPDERVGIVANNVEGAARFASQIRSYTSADSELLLSPTNEEIEAMAQRVDVFVSSRSQYKRVLQLGMDVPVIELPFYISDTSVIHLMSKLNNLSTENNHLSATLDAPTLDAPTLDTERLGTAALEAA